MSRNEEVADVLEEFSTYLKLDGQEGRAAAYSKAARSIRKASYMPPDPSRLDGVGGSIRQTIAKYQRSGSIEELEDLKEEYSWYEELKKVDGIGPARAKELNHKLMVDDLDDLILVGDDVTMLSGVGEKTKNKWMRSAKELRDE